MSGEGRDSIYKPTLKTARGPVRESRRVNKQADYSEVELVTSDSNSEGTAVNSESGIESIKLEPGVTELELGSERDSAFWKSGILKNTANQVNEQFLRFVVENSELVMAREIE